MSAALVRKALEISSEADKVSTQLKKTKKGKSLKSKTKKTAAKLQKQNLKILKALQYKGKTTAEKLAESNNKKKKSGSKAVGFTDEDFEKFEKEYFVSQ